MKKYLFSVYDNVAEVFNNPFTEINNATATRSFVNSFSDNPNKNDISLYLVGEYNDSNGDIKAIKPKRIYSGLDIKKEE